MKKNNLVKKNISVKNIKNYILIMVCGVLVVSSVLMTIDTAASGAEIASLQKTETKLSDQKRVLEEGLVRGISMSDLQQKSVELGFIKPETLVYVSDQDTSNAAPVAILP